MCRKKQCLPVPELMALYHETLRNSGLRENTADRYTVAAQNFVEWVSAKNGLAKSSNTIQRLLVVKPKDVQDYLHYLRVHKGYTDSSLNFTLTSLRRLYSELEECCERYSLDPFRNPMSRIRNNVISRCIVTHIELGERDYQRCMSMVRGRNRLRDVVIISLMFDLHLTPSELSDLRLDDVNLERRKLKIHHARGGKSRELDIPDRCLETIKSYLSAYRSRYAKPGTGAFLVSQTKSQELSARMIQKHVKKWMNDAGIPGSSHSWRQN